MYKFQDFATDVRNGARLTARCVMVFALAGSVDAFAADANIPKVCTAAARAADWLPPRVHAGESVLTFDELIDRLESKQVIFLGEYHDRYEHHLNQVEVICRLVERGRKVAIGMEAFQQPFQSVLDVFIAGDIDEPALLRESEYFGRWSFDYRLYAPILRFARDKSLPLLAMNLPAELTRKVGRGGLGSLDEREREQVPASIDRSSERYRKRIHRSYQMHPQETRQNFEHFLDVQLLWDEGMAARAAQFVMAHPRQTLIVIAGEGHVTHGDGVPMRLERRVPSLASAIVLQSVARIPEADAADFALETRALELPAPGRLGVLVEEASDGVAIRELTEDSAAAAAGARARDRIVAINGAVVESLADVRIALYDKVPGNRVDLEMRRPGSAEAQSYKLRFRLR